MTEAEVIEQLVPGSPKWNLNKLKAFWRGTRDTFLIGLIFTLLGTAIGVKVSKDYYQQKIADVVATGAMLFDKKVYTISPKL